MSPSTLQTWCHRPSCKPDVTVHPVTLSHRDVRPENVMSLSTLQTWCHRPPCQRDVTVHPVNLSHRPPCKRESPSTLQTCHCPSTSTQQTWCHRPPWKPNVTAHHEFDLFMYLWKLFILVSYIQIISNCTVVIFIDWFKLYAQNAFTDFGDVQGKTSWQCVYMPVSLVIFLAIH